jgi:hypothetical protein
LPKILAIAQPWGRRQRDGAGTGRAMVVFAAILLDMANVPGIIAFVIQITVLARKQAQYPASKCREKIMQVPISDSILGTTSKRLILFPRADMYLDFERRILRRPKFRRDG